jgi:tetratricopeptide (TPR) repeat protein
LLAAAQGDLESALGYYSEALEGFRDAGYDYEAARTLEAAAEVRRLRGSPVDLETALQAGREAEQIFERLASG